MVCHLRGLYRLPRLHLKPERRLALSSSSYVASGYALVLVLGRAVFAVDTVLHLMHPTLGYRTC
jgi:hypothetical protein